MRRAGHGQYKVSDGFPYSCVWPQMLSLNSMDLRDVDVVPEPSITVETKWFLEDQCYTCGCFLLYHDDTFL